MCEDELPDPKIAGGIVFSAVLFLDDEHDYWICKAGRFPVCIGHSQNLNYEIERLNKVDNETNF